MKYDQYEIKKVQIVAGMSEETECFSLDLYVRGNKFAHVMNHGRGGSHNVYPYAPFTHNDIDRVGKEMLDDKFLCNSEFEPFDTGVSSLLSLWVIAKDLKRDFKKTAVFIVDGKDGTLPYKNKKAPDQFLFDEVKRRYPNAIILNTMDVAEAAKLILIQARKTYEQQWASEHNGPRT